MTVTVLRIDTGKPFIEVAEMESNADGSVSFKLPNDQYAGQDPAGYGVRADGPAKQQYQRATLNGNAVTFYPLVKGDGGILFPPYVYLIGFGKIYPA